MERSPATLGLMNVPPRTENLVPVQGADSAIASRV
jgi:hypothetical protein